VDDLFVAIGNLFFFLLLDEFLLFLETCHPLYRRGPLSLQIVWHTQVESASHTNRCQRVAMAEQPKSSALSKSS